MAMDVWPGIGLHQDECAANAGCRRLRAHCVCVCVCLLLLLLHAVHIGAQPAHMGACSCPAVGSCGPSGAVWAYASKLVVLLVWRCARVLAQWLHSKRGCSGEGRHLRCWSWNVMPPACLVCQCACTVAFQSYCFGWLAYQLDAAASEHGRGRRLPSPGTVDHGTSMSNGACVVQAAFAACRQVLPAGRVRCRHRRHAAMQCSTPSAHPSQGLVHDTAQPAQAGQGGMHKQPARCRRPPIRPVQGASLAAWRPRLAANAWEQRPA